MRAVVGTVTVVLVLVCARAEAQPSVAAWTARRAEAALGDHHGAAEARRAERAGAFERAAELWSALADDPAAGTTVRGAAALLAADRWRRLGDVARAERAWMAALRSGNDEMAALARVALAEADLAAARPSDALARFDGQRDTQPTVALVEPILIARAHLASGRPAAAMPAIRSVQQAWSRSADADRATFVEVVAELQRVRARHEASAIRLPEAPATAATGLMERVAHFAEALRQRHAAVLARVARHHHVVTYGLTRAAVEAWMEIAAEYEAFVRWVYDGGEWLGQATNAPAVRFAGALDAAVQPIECEAIFAYLRARRVAHDLGADDLLHRAHAALGRYTFDRSLGCRTWLPTATPPSAEDFAPLVPLAPSPPGAGPPPLAP